MSQCNFSLYNKTFSSRKYGRISAQSAETLLQRLIKDFPCVFKDVLPYFQLCGAMDFCISFHAMRTLPFSLVSTSRSCVLYEDCLHGHGDREEIIAMVVHAM